MENGQSGAVAEAGDLYFLQHPTAEDTFSGFGVTMKPGRNDHLVGLLMVDRPTPVDPAWLAEIEETFGEHSLVPMLATGERGIACQMHVEAGSLAMLTQRDDPLADGLRQALTPLREQTPKPELKVRWEEERQLWTSRPWIGLPLELQDVFDRNGPGCFAVEREDMVAFVTHASDRDIESFRGAPVLYHWELMEFPSAPIIRFRATIFDDELAPYGLEHFLNIEDPEQARCLARLARQEEIAFDFFGDGYEYAYSKHLAHSEEMRAELAAISERAAAHWESISEDAQDFDLAKAQFQQLFPF